MVVIRLSRGGAKGRPFYDVVVSDSRTARDGQPIARLGYYNPIANQAQVAIEIDMERYNHWRGLGAKPSATVANLVKKFLKTNQKAAAA